MSIEDDVDANFPMAEYREGQRETILFALDKFLNEDKKFVIAECPTGSGKSPIAYTVMRQFESSYWLTIQKTLQDQLMAEFGEHGNCIADGAPYLQDLKGRNAYLCTLYKRIVSGDTAVTGLMQHDRALTKMANGTTCDDAECKKKNMSFLTQCFNQNGSVCPYWDQKIAATNGSHALMNFSSFLYQTKMSDIGPNGLKPFKPRSLLILDEAHNIEPQLMSFVELTISDREFNNITFPEYDTALDYYMFFKDNGIKERLIEKIHLAKLQSDQREADRLDRILFKHNIFMKHGKMMDWVVDFKTNISSHIVTLKPVFIDHFADNLLFSLADHVLMMSGTILSSAIMRENLGIDKGDCASLRMKNRFPVENRKIYYTPVGPMNFRSKAKTFPKMVERVEEICDDHKGERGIIHTHNFEIAYKIINGVGKSVGDRLLFQEDFQNKTEMLDTLRCTEGGIIIAPAMHEGVDLKDDDSRFQIICKVPYPSLQDPQIKARMSVSNKFYQWLTANKLIQSYGRSVRSEDDWAVTYILDEDFLKFSKSANKLLPGWFTEAIEWS